MAWVTDQELKDRFAVEWLRKGDPWPAALAVIGHQDPGRASQVAAQWPFDPYVKAQRARLIEENGEEYYLPTKTDLARKVWQDAENDRLTAKDRTSNYRLYAEIMGFIEKDAGKGGKLDGNITVTLAESDQKL